MSVVTQIVESSVLQPNSPYAMVKTALENTETSRLVGRFFSSSITHR
jgi:hypothetical protein